MPMDPKHLRGHLEDLKGRIGFLRPLQPDNPSYKMWLGDVIELVNVQWGLQSTQMLQLRAAIGRSGRRPEGTTMADHIQSYQGRLDDIDAVLESFIRGLVAPITFFE